MSPRSRVCVTGLILAGILVANATCEVPTPIPTPTITATMTVTPTVTITFTPTLTPTPTLTATPTNTPTPIPTAVITTTVSIGWDPEYAMVEGDPDAWKLWVDLELQAADGRRLDGWTVASDCRPTVGKPGDEDCQDIVSPWVIPETEVDGCRLWVCLRWTDGVEEVRRCRFKDVE